MAHAPPHGCAQPRCPRLIPHGQQCPDHPRRQGYTWEWKTYAKAWLRRFPTCGMRQDGQLHATHSACVRRGEQAPAHVVDHIVSLVAGGALMDPRNHQSLCRSCNRRKG